jgi:hypothetical protein
MGENQNQIQVIPPWMSQGALNLDEPLHGLPKCPKTLLLRFDLKKYNSLEDHVKNSFWSPISLTSAMKTWFVDLLIVKYDHVQHL